MRTHFLPIPYLMLVLLTACNAGQTAPPPTLVISIPSPRPLPTEFLAPSATPGPTPTVQPGAASEGDPTAAPSGEEPTALAEAPATPTEPPTEPDRAARQARLASVQDWLYQLQNLNIEQAATSNFDLLVTDYSSDGSAEGQWSTAQVARLRQGPQGERIVLAYMSIGEAEDYRFYWNPVWDDEPRDGVPDGGAPGWLDVGNEEWCGLPAEDWCNYKVRYWDADWQRIVFGSPQAYLDRIIDAGFDGVYMDIIDAYYYFEETEGRTQAGPEMVAFVTELANYARVTRGRPNFMIFPQNGEELAQYPEFLTVIDGMGKEDIFYDDDTPMPQEEIDWVQQFVRQVRDSGGLVLSVDYVTEPANIADYYARARAEGYVPYATTRDLDRFTINPGFEP